MTTTGILTYLIGQYKKHATLRVEKKITLSLRELIEVAPSDQEIDSFLTRLSASASPLPPDARELLQKYVLSKQPDWVYL